MAKQFNEWLDEFIENGFDSNNVTHWPEEGSKPVVVEELPEDPVFGKVYAMEDGGETTYYTTDVNGNWINLTEGAQTGGIVDVEYLSEATEPNVTYNVTVGDAEYGPGLYYSIMDDNTGSGYLLFISLDGITYNYNNDNDAHIVLSPDYDYIGGEAIFRCYEGDTAFINIDGSGNLSSDRYFPYNYTESSGVTDILDAIYPYSAQKSGGVFFINNEGNFDTTSNYDTLIIPTPEGSSYESAPIYSSEEIIVYDNGEGIQHSSGYNEIYWKYHSSNGTYTFNGLQDESAISEMLTDAFGSNGMLTSGMIYYPQGNLGNQEYHRSSKAFEALIAPQAYLDGNDTWVSDGCNWNSYSMEPGKTYQIVESSGDYVLHEGAPDYFETENEALQALENSIQHEVSSGDVFHSIYYPYLSSGTRHYDKTYNRPYGYWLRGNLNEYSQADGQEVYGYNPQRLWNEYDHQQTLGEDDICNFLNVAKAGLDNNYGYHDEYAGDFWSNADMIYYPNRDGGVDGYDCISWTENNGTIILLGHDNQWSGYYPRTATMDNNHLYYQYIIAAGSANVNEIGSVALPVDSTPVQVTINGVSYTITKN